MRLYLARHGEAVSGDVDPARPLSKRGRAEVRRVAHFLAHAGVSPRCIRHSGKSRARQTAELLAAAFGPPVHVEESAGLDPYDATDDLGSEAGEWTEDVMVVGHLPFLERLISRLLVGDESAPVVSFSPATVVCLERAEEGQWSILWMVRPQLLAWVEREAPWTACE